jgi:hypothetical protein
VAPNPLDNDIEAKLLVELETLDNESKVLSAPLATFASIMRLF